MRVWTRCSAVLGLCLLASQVLAQEKFADLVGPVGVQDVKKSSQIEVPYITWGGDVATFLANGGTTTKKGTIFADAGLNLKLVGGDDFVQQVRDYMAGKRPFLRGTMRMMGLAGEVIGSDPRTKPVVFMQLTWSAGDHVVARPSLKTLNDLATEDGKKIKIACQKGGPHVGLIDDVLRLVSRPRTNESLGWDDVEIVWVPDLTGENGPAELFRKDSSIDACCVISPDMIGLTGGFEAKGTGAEGTVQGAHVLASTAWISHSIADVYACRADWFKTNRATVEKFTSGYLKACDAIGPMRDGFEQSGKMTTQYKDVLKMSQDIFGAEVLPTLEIDAHGLLLDCTYAGLSGNEKFFKDAGFTDGYAAKAKAALDLAVSQGWAAKRSEFTPADFDYTALAKSAGIKRAAPGAEISSDFFETYMDTLTPEKELDPDTLVSFTIYFEPNQVDFPVAEYREYFDRAVRSASTAGNAAVVIQGHSDPTLSLKNLVTAGIRKQLITSTGPPSHKYYLKTPGGMQPLDLNQTETIVQLIEAGQFEGSDPSPKQTMQAAMDLSHTRAENVKQRIIDYAKQQGLNLNEDQFQPVGAGILDPVIPKPRSLEQAKENMRVKLRIVRIPAEAIQKEDFDF